MIIITQRIIYPHKTYTSSYPLPENYKIPDECFTLRYEHHFWVNRDDYPQGGDKCFCGKEQLEEGYRWR